jgi:hypothetical protein
VTAEVTTVRVLIGRERGAEAGVTVSAAEVHPIQRGEEAPAITASQSQWRGRMVDQDHAKIPLITEVTVSTKMKAQQL